MCSDPWSSSVGLRAMCQDMGFVLIRGVLLYVVCANSWDVVCAITIVTPINPHATNVETFVIMLLP